MKTEIFIVTYAKDFPWLKYCLRSIAKFATGFSGVTILVPQQDLEALAILALDPLTDGHKNQFILPIPINFLDGEEWENAGMLWHMAQIMRADEWCPDADFICHLDPDCVFTAPVTPDTFIYKGKPILRYEKFSEIGRRHPGVLRWKECAEHALPFPVPYETMRCHPEVYHRTLYAAARERIEAKVGIPMDAFIRMGRNEFPQSFCEFVTLGNVAMHLFPDKYVFVEQHGDEVLPPNHLQQFWSHGALDQPQNIWVKGVQKLVTPIQMLAELGLT